MRFNKTALQLEKMETIKVLAKKSTEMAVSDRQPISNEDYIDLEKTITGKIVYPDSPTYNTAKCDFNLAYSAQPLMIVYVANYQDIRTCLAFADKFQILVTIRSGGHSLAAYSISDGMIIDISMLKNISVNYEDKTAVIEAGNTFGNINPHLEFYGLHIPGGGCSDVSVAGYMQGGGYGMTSRQFGINSDCVLEIQVMLGDGSIVIANETQNEDLFWAVRGGTGGNFGILLNIKYRLFPLDQIWGVRISWDFETDCTNAANALVVIQDHYLTGNQLPNLGIQMVLNKDNSGDGNRKLWTAITFIGSEAELDNALKPLLSVPGNVVTLKEQGKYSKINELVLDNVPDLAGAKNILNMGAYSRSTYISKSLTAEDYKSILNYFKTAPNNFTTVDMEGYGGNINSYPVEKSAFIHRQVTMDFFCDVFFDLNDTDPGINSKWLNEFFVFMEQFGNGHSYQNYPNREQTDFQWAYWGQYYEQLRSIKEKYNPKGLFKYQQSIGGPMTSNTDKPQISIFNTSKSIVREPY